MMLHWVTYKGVLMQVLFAIMSVINCILLVHFYLKYKELLAVFVRLFEKAPLLMELIKEHPQDDTDHDSSHGFI